MSLRTTREIFFNQKPDCFSRKSLIKTPEKLYRSDDEVQLYISDLKEKLSELFLEEGAKSDLLLKDKEGNRWVLYAERLWRDNVDIWFVWWSYIPWPDRTKELFWSRYKKYFQDCDNFRWQWYGVLLYLSVGIFLTDQGYTLHSNTKCNDSVKWIRNSLISSGLAWFDKEKRLFTMDNQKLREHFL